MAGEKRRRAAALPRPVAIFLLVAVAVGIAAALLSSPTPSTPAPTTTHNSEFVPFWVILAVIVSFLVLLISVVVLARLSTGGVGIPLRFSLIVFAAFAVGLAFVVIVHFVAPGGPGLLLTPQGNSTSTGATGAPPGPGGGNNTSNMGNATTLLPGVDLSGLAVWIGLGLLVIFAIAVAAPLAAVMTNRREEEPEPEPASHAVRKVFAEALAELVTPEEPTDPRRIMVRLYARLLERVGPSIDNLEAATPREIERACVQQLHIDPATSARLRHLFEQARYSTLPFGPAEVEEAREALSAVLAELPAPRLVA